MIAESVRFSYQEKLHLYNKQKNKAGEYLCPMCGKPITEEELRGDWTRTVVASGYFNRNLVGYQKINIDLSKHHFNYAILHAGGACEDFGKRSYKVVSWLKEKFGAEAIEQYRQFMSEITSRNSVRFTKSHIDYWAYAKDLLDAAIPVRPSPPAEN